MKTTINERRLDVLAREIARLDEEVVTARRAAGDLDGGEVACSIMDAMAAEKRVELEEALRAYFLESEFIRRGDLRRVAA